MMGFFGNILDAFSAFGLIILILSVVIFIAIKSVGHYRGKNQASS